MCRGQWGPLCLIWAICPVEDHTIVTQPDATIAALESGLKLLRPGGIITTEYICGHRGKGGGCPLGEVFLHHFPRSYHVLSYRFLNQQNHPPYLLAIEKR